ncbi:hypothetical protein BDC45DRAFT_115451 [Circinella umbellata]|nr:hypothetical protein BDC45DRAFT_115451 [Circinella umbellata]
MLRKRKVIIEIYRCLLAYIYTFALYGLYLKSIIILIPETSIIIQIWTAVALNLKMVIDQKHCLFLLFFFYLKKNPSYFLFFHFFFLITSFTFYFSYTFIHIMSRIKNLTSTA